MARSEKKNLGDLAAKARATSLLGAVVSGRYRIVELIAMGGVGSVFLAEHVHMHKHVAVKVLHPDPGGGPDLVARFEREAVAGAHIQHPNVAAATDFGRLDDGSSFLVLEYVRGTTLRDVIRRGPLSPARATHIVKQTAAALGAAHAMGIIHRDVKPRNVMLIEGERDVVKLIDFGLAKLELREVSEVAAARASFHEERITTSGAVFGTIAYLAPEAAMGMDTLDARADLYALGLLLYELLAGCHPFPTTDPVELFRYHHKVKPPPIAVRAPGVVVPPALEAIAMRLLEKTPEARYQDAASVIAALDAAYGIESVSAAPLSLGGLTPVFPGPSLFPPPSRPSQGSVNPPPDLFGPSSRPAPAMGVAAAPTTPPSPAVISVPPPVAPAAAPVVADPAAAPPEPSIAPAEPRRRGPLLAAVAIGVITGGVALGVLVARTASVDPVAPSGSSSAVASAAASVRVGTASAPVGTGEPPKPPAPSTAPTPSAAPRAASGDVDAARALLRRQVTSRDFPHANETFFALTEQGPAAVHDPTLLAPLRDLAGNAALGGGEGADRVFAALADRCGPDGPDVLFELVRTRGGSKAATRALELLSKPEILARATPALRATVTLRQAPCNEKAGLLDKAAQDGDLRTLVVMETVVAVCLPRNKQLEEAVRTLKQRLR